jgi:hypothetical protein
MFVAQAENDVLKHDDSPRPVVKLVGAEMVGGSDLITGLRILPIQ